MSRVQVLDEETIVRFKFDGIQPPSDLYVNRSDALFLTSYNSASGLTIHVRYTMMRPDGVIVPGALDTHVPNTNRTAKSTIMNIGEGFLLSLSVFLGSGSARRGQCYIQVGIQRGVGGAAFVHRILTQAYIGTALNTSWPGGRFDQPSDGPGYLRAITGTVPAAGAEIVETVPTGARWRLKGLSTVLTASAAVATRQAALAIDDGSTTFSVSNHVDTVTAGVARNYNWSEGAWNATAISSDNDACGIAFDLRIAAAFRIRTQTGSIQAGDQYQAPRYLVEEWIEP